MYRQTDERSAARDFFHHLRDTLVLLGVDEEFANLVETPAEISPANVADLRRFNGKLIDDIKLKLVNINKLAIEVGETGEDSQ